jgi:hypothetical protein
VRIFYVQFEAVPLPESQEFEQCGGAYVNCWLSAESETQAAKLASASVREAGWRVVAVEEACREVDKAYYSENDEGREHFEQATLDGECYVFHQWPIEDQEARDVH